MNHVTKVMGDPGQICLDLFSRGWRIKSSKREPFGPHEIESVRFVNKKLGQMALVSYAVSGGDPVADTAAVEFYNHIRLRDFV